MNTRNNLGSFAEFKTGVGAEIGVQFGTFSNQILSQWKGKLISVDTWDDPPVYEHAKKVLNTERSILIKKPSNEAVKEVADGSLDFVYIDACHTYENTREDIELWAPKVRHGGIVAGHDYMNWVHPTAEPFGVRHAVDEYCVNNGYKLNIAPQPDMWEGVAFPTWYFFKEIPRIIYYTWVNPNPMPGEFEKYILGWKALMPDYRVEQISLDNIVKTPFVNEALKRGLYAVAGHYGRCERLLKGGIYFDIDVEAQKRFDPLLKEQFFVASESPSRVNNAVIGSIPGHPFIKEALEFMNNFDFNKPGRLGVEIETGPEMFTRIAKRRGWQERNETQRMEDFTVFDSSYFFPYSFEVRYSPACITENTFAVHHWAGTWSR